MSLLSREYRLQGNAGHMGQVVKHVIGCFELAAIYGDHKSISAFSGLEAEVRARLVKKRLHMDVQSVN